ncbi:patched domain-containing protein 3-like [Centruroides sculpturatus]|uniref:patched domain-containing protein 3-like n=1 Tax=Centruroides sculpturatus TaxID=218467 RepID=UPI000C6D5D57|nr:patched domain-containing protein 3-like [Centruroides sculpturatus]
MKYNYIQRLLSHLYSRLAYLIACHPIYFLLVPMLLSFALSSGLTKIIVSRDTNYLFVSQSGRSQIDKKFMNTWYPLNTSYNFDFKRLNEKPKAGYLMIKPRDDGSIFRDHVFEKIIILDKIVKNISIEYEGKRYTYEELCARNGKECVENTVMKLVPYVHGIASGEHSVKYPVDMNTVTYYRTYYAVNLGQVKTDKQRNILDAKAVRLMYPLDISNKFKYKIAVEWERMFIKSMINVTFPDITIEVFVTSSLDDELKRITESVLKLCPVVFVVILIYSILINMSFDCVRSKPWLGISACISASLALIASFGFVSYCGVKYADINIALPFLILGIEVDDAYVLIAAWRRTNPEDGVQKRLENVYSDAAVSITITSITTFLSFCIGITTPYAVIKLFSFYAATAVFFAFVYQITFFGGCLALSGFREQKNLHPLTFHTLSEKSKQNEVAIMKIFRDYLGNILALQKTKMIVLVVFVSNLVVSGLGLRTLKEGMEFSDIFYSDSEIIKGFGSYYKYFTQYPFAVSVVINDVLDYSDPKVQNLIDEMIFNFTSHPNVASQDLVISWLKYYKIIAQSPIGMVTLRGYNLSEKTDFLDGLNRIFLNFQPAKVFRGDIVFNEDKTEIVSSRFLLVAKNVNSRTVENKLLEDLRKIADSSPLPLLVYSYLFPFFEETLLIRSLTFQVGWVTALLLVGIFFLFLPSLKYSLCVAVAIVSSLFCTVGYMSLWAVKIDMLSTIVLIVSVGFSINYPAHISFAYIVNKSKCGEERLKESLYGYRYASILCSFYQLLYR